MFKNILLPLVLGNALAIKTINVYFHTKTISIIQHIIPALKQEPTNLVCRQQIAGVSR